MGTKLNPGRFDCYENADPDEPMFILLARDIDAPKIVRMWAHQREARKRREMSERGEDIMPFAEVDQINEALQCAEAMEKWRKEKR